MKKLLTMLCLALTLGACGGSALQNAQTDTGLLLVGVTSAQHQVDSVVCSDATCTQNVSKANDAIEIAKSALQTTVASLEAAVTGDVALIWQSVAPCLAVVFENVLQALKDCGVSVPVFLQSAIDVIHGFLGPCPVPSMLRAH